VKLLTKYLPPLGILSPFNERGGDKGLGHLFLRGLSRVVKVSQMVMFWLNMGSAALIAVLGLITISDVIRRTLMGRALVGAVEITEFLMVAIVFLAIPYTQVRDEHVKIEVVTSRLRGKTKIIVKIVMLLLGACFLTIVMWQGIWDALQAWRIGEYKFGPGTVRLYAWPARFMVPFGCFWFLIQLGIDIGRQIQLLLSDGLCAK